MEVITMQCFKDLTFAVSGKVKLSFGHWDCIVNFFNFNFILTKVKNIICLAQSAVTDTLSLRHVNGHTHTPAHKSICSCIFMTKIDRNFQTTLKGWKGYNDRPFFLFFQQRRVQWQTFFSCFFNREGYNDRLFISFFVTENSFMNEYIRHGWGTTP